MQGVKMDVRFFPIKLTYHIWACDMYGVMRTYLTGIGRAKMIYKNRNHRTPAV